MKSCQSWESLRSAGKGKFSATTSVRILYWHTSLNYT